MPRVMADGNVDGVILAGGHSAEMIDRIQAVIPTVVVNDRISGAGVSCIAVDDAAAVRGFGADVVAAPAHKWLHGTAGVAMLWLRAGR